MSFNVLIVGARMIIAMSAIRALSECHRTARIGTPARYCKFTPAVVA